MQTGWIFDGFKYYYLDESGVMQTGWINDGGERYYLNESGAMQTGWLLDNDGRWYYLTEMEGGRYNTNVSGELDFPTFHPQES